MIVLHFRWHGSEKIMKFNIIEGFWGKKSIISLVGDKHSDCFKESILFWLIKY